LWEVRSLLKANDFGQIKKRENPMETLLTMIPEWAICMAFVSMFLLGVAVVWRLARRLKTLRVGKVEMQFDDAKSA
jgi:hypothetical protein